MSDREEEHCISKLGFDHIPVKVKGNTVTIGLDSAISNEIDKIEFGCAHMHAVHFEEPRVALDFSGFRAGGTAEEFARGFEMIAQISQGEYVFRDRNRLRRLHPRSRNIQCRTLTKSTTS